LAGTGPGRPGTTSLQHLLADRAPGYVAPESELEALFLRLLDRYGLPGPARQYNASWVAAGGRVDFAYLPQLIVIEVDGRRWHGRNADYNRDRARDRFAQRAGWMVLRYTYSEVKQLPELVALEIAETLASRSVGS
jgi:very-short-patch-repair endonuclease